MKPGEQAANYTAAEEYMLQRLKDELSPSLSYHGVHHTQDVMRAAMHIADDEQLTDADRALLRVAVAFHDAGFLFIYHGHEERGCELAKEILPGYHFSAEQIETVCKMIMSTKIPQDASSLLEEIICDADLDYLGRADVGIVAETLFEELKNRKEVTTQEQWNKIQIEFLQSHHYHTRYAKEQREVNKEDYLEQLLMES